MTKNNTPPTKPALSKIGRVMLRNGITAAQLARAVRASRSAAGLWKRGRREPKTSMALSIHAFLRKYEPNLTLKQLV